MRILGFHGTSALVSFTLGLIAVSPQAAAVEGVSTGPDQVFVNSQESDHGNAAAYKFGQGLLSAAKQMSEGQSVSALLKVSEESIDYLLPAFGDDFPEWVQRIEVDISANENNTPSYSVLGVFPLFESEDLQNTVFTQISQQRYRYLGDDRDVTNVGIGYRRLLFSNTVLVGANSFFDYGWKYHHQRASVGGELKWAGLDLSANYYMRATGRHSVDANTFEEVLDGHDFRVAMQVPYLPWARVHGRRYWWHTNINTEDIKGWELGLEMDLHQNLQLEAGLISDNYIDDENNNEGYIKMRMRFEFNRPVAFSDEFVSDSPWLMRDMTEYRLDKVRRENRIIVERISSGVVITRGN